MNHFSHFSVKRHDSSPQHQKLDLDCGLYFFSQPISFPNRETTMVSSQSEKLTRIFLLSKSSQTGNVFGSLADSLWSGEHWGESVAVVHPEMEAALLTLKMGEKLVRNWKEVAQHNSTLKLRGNCKWEISWRNIGIHYLPLYGSEDGLFNPISC